MNIVQITGRLTKDPELRYSANGGTAFTTVTIAVDDYDYKNKEKIAYFIPVVIWGKAAENLAKYQNKGSKILVKGKLRVRSYDAQDGTKRYVTEVVADNNGGIEYMSSVNKDGYANNSQGYGNNYNNGANYNNNSNYNNGNQNYSAQQNNNQNNYGNQPNYNASQTNNNQSKDLFEDAFSGFGGGDFMPVDEGDMPF